MLFSNVNKSLIAFVTAVIVWIFVNQSITETKTIPNVPVRVLNLPADKTIMGLLPNGYMNHRMTLTLSGSKDVIQQLEQGDMEIHLDASTAESDDWFVQINKKNLVSLNPSFDLRSHINQVSHPDLAIKLSQLITEKIPITVKRPVGQAPEGYDFLDVWPEQLMQTMSGPKEEILKLKSKGLDLTLDLNKITRENLDHLKKTKKSDHDDEISFYIPDKWKKVLVKFKNNKTQEINDPEAQHLRIDFLKKELLPIKKEIPISIFYPIKSSDTINPSTTKLVETKDVQFLHGIPLFTPPAYVKDVSKRFLDIIRDHLEIVIIAAPENDIDSLQWTLEVIDTREMEDIYVALELAEQKEYGHKLLDTRDRESVFRKRFKDYMQKLTLYNAKGERLEIKSQLQQGKIVVTSD